MKKRVLAAILASATILSVVGCSNNTTSGDSKDSSVADSGSSSVASGDSSAADASSDASSDAGDAVELKDDGDCLTILAWTSNADIDGLVKFFIENTDYTEDQIKWVGVGENGEGARDQYKQYLLGNDDADLMVCDADWITDYINDESLTAPYSAIGLSKADFTDAFSYVLDYGTAADGTFKAASFQATPGGFLYRADLAKEYLGVNSPAEMQELVKDWDTFQATANKLFEASGGKVAMQATESGMWQVYQSNRTQAWVVDGKLVMDNAEGFYDIAKSMSDAGTLTNIAGMWEPEWTAAFNDGSVFGDFVPTWGLANTGLNSLVEMAAGAKFDEAGNCTSTVLTSDQLALCEGPSGWFWGGSYFAVSNKCDNKTIAKDFIEFYCKNADTMGAYSAKTGDFMNNKAAMSTATASNKYLKDNQNHFEILVSVLDRLDLSNKLTVYDSVIKGLFNDSVAGYIKGTYATKEEAIEAFKDGVAAKYPDIVIE